MRDAPARLREMLAGDEVIVAPGVFDALSARLVEQAGFGAVYASGGAIARSMGYPDLGLVSMSEVIDRVQLIAEAVEVPVIADADTGYGNALNARRAAQAFARAGVAAIHIEDQGFPKRCGHYDDKSLVPAQELTQKLHAARDAAPELVLIARTDAIAVEGLESAIARSQAYAAAGADVLFIEAPTTESQIEEIARRVPQPKLINMFQGGKTPLLPAGRLGALGYRIVIIPSDLQRAAMHAMRTTLDAIRRDGDSSAVQDRMASFDEREEVVGTAGYLELDARYGAAGASPAAAADRVR